MRDYGGQAKRQPCYEAEGVESKKLRRAHAGACVWGKEKDGALSGRDVPRHDAQAFHLRSNLLSKRRRTGR